MRTLALLLTLLAARQAAAQACTPFGDAPETLVSSPTPRCTGGTRLGPWPDPDGTPRWACLWTPRAAVVRPLPLVVYLHPSLSTADSAHGSTELASFVDDANLSGDPNLPGFILLAPQGRDTTHHYPAPDQKGTGWDIWYRQLDPAGDVTVNGTLYRENVDAAAIDHFIAAEVATGKVDTQRIFLSGWSNGTSLAYEYALNRPNVAAIAVYSGADPYDHPVSDPCPQVPVAGAAASAAQVHVFAPHVAAYQVHNACDVGGMCPNVLRLESTLAGFGALTDDTLLDASQNAVSRCVAACGTDPDGSTGKLLAGTVGLAHHVRWPKRWTEEMLEFLAQHPLRGEP
jgi:poly(3-hydroxybutyrate) depolymerase